MPKQRVQPLASMKEDIARTIHRAEQMSEAIVDGDWYVWGDPVEAVLENVSYETMKNKVDEDTTNTLYGENTKNGDLYEGGA